MTDDETAAFEAAQDLCKSCGVFLRKSGGRVSVCVKAKHVCDGPDAGEALLNFIKTDAYADFVRRNFQALAMAAAIVIDIDAFDAALEALGFVDDGDDEDDEDEDDGEAGSEDEEESDSGSRIGRMTFRRE